MSKLERKESFIQQYLDGVNLKRFDIFFKLDDDFKIKTQGGAICKYYYSLRLLTLLSYLL